MKNNLKLLPLLLLCLFSLLACDFVSPPSAEEPEENTAPPTAIRPATKTPSGVTYGTIARQHLTTLCEEIGPRLPGSPEEAEAAEYIQAAFKTYGYDSQVQRFAFTNDDIDSTFPSRIDHHLNVFITLRYDALTRFTISD